MKINAPLFMFLLLAELSLTSCSNLPTVPGESKTSEETRGVVLSGIYQIENRQYHCTPQELSFNNTKFVQATNKETTEEWYVGSCVNDVHTYVISYELRNPEAIIYHENTDKTGNTSSILWATPKYSNDASEIKNEFNQKIEAARLSVLNESPETEAILQKGKGEQHDGKHWLSLCDTLILKFNEKIIGRAMQVRNSFAPSRNSLCYNWYGTRHEWKETILKNGCLSRCGP